MGLISPSYYSLRPNLSEHFVHFALIKKIVLVKKREK